MTLPSSPPITLLQVYTEFGAPVGTPLSQFYQGGPWVGTGGANANVPTSPPISLLNLLGAALGGVTSAFVASVSPNKASASGKTGVIGTTIFTCQTTGQTGSVSFQWVLISGDSTIHISSPTSASTSFTVDVTSGNSYSAIYQCICTDSAANVTRSNTISVNLFSSAGSNQTVRPGISRL